MAHVIEFLITVIQCFITQGTLWVVYTHKAPVKGYPVNLIDYYLKPSTAVTRVVKKMEPLTGPYTCKPPAKHK